MSDVKKFMMAYAMLLQSNNNRKEKDEGRSQNGGLEM